MTPESLLKLFKKYELHIGDGGGDWCSGEDEEAMLEAATEILKILKEGDKDARAKKES